MALTRLSSASIGTNAVDADELSATGVTAGTYGSASAIPQFTVDEDGRISAASQNTITSLSLTTLTTTGDLTVGGDIIVTGDTITLTTQNLVIEDNIVTLTLNSNVEGPPLVDAGLEVNRGTSPTVGIHWNETSEVWELTVDGTNYYEILTTNSSIDASQLTTITSLGTITTGTWQATNVDIFYGGTGASTAGAARQNLGLDIGVDIQAYSSELSGLSGLSSTGLVSRTASDTYAPRTITAGTGITITNGSGVGGNPIISLTNNSITINGSNVSLGGSTTIDALPSQTGESGKYLTTNGTTASWVDIQTGNTWTADTTPHASPISGDKWYDTANNILYEYQDDGTNSYWVDISTSNVTSTWTNTYIDGLLDVDTTTTAPTNGQALLWNSSSSKWVPGSYSDLNGVLDFAAFSTDIIPATDVTYSLGSPTKQWADVYIGPGSLYVNGKQVISDVSDKITVSTDLNQHLRFETTGTGNLELDAAGSGVISVQSALQIQAGSNITSSDGNAINFANQIAVDNLTSRTTNGNLSLAGNGTGYVYVNDDLVVGGNLTISGTTTTINTETLSVADNIIDLNSNFTSGSPTENAGIRIIRGDSNNVSIRWNESSDKWEFTNDGTTYSELGAGTVTLASFSVTDSGGDGSLSYNNSTGVITYTGPSATEVRSHFSAGTGISISSGQISATPYLTWEIVTSNTVCIAGKGYFVNTSSGALTMTLPTSASLGDTIRFNDLAGTFGTYNLTVARNGHKIQGVADDLLVADNQSSFGLVYSNSTYGWKIMEL